MPIRSGTVLRRRTLFEEAVDIIEREYASELELDGVSRRLATSRRQLQRAFAEAGQTSFRREGRRAGEAGMSVDGSGPAQTGGNLDGDRPSLAYSTAPV